jgi:hypothetical protein
MNLEITNFQHSLIQHAFSQTYKIPFLVSFLAAIPVDTVNYSTTRSHSGNEPVTPARRGFASH